jgi:probable phosphoglycerate mutase
MPLRDASGADQAPLLGGPFCFLRHGETEPNRLGLIAGSNDVPLNATGRAQARAAALRLANAGIDAIWTSPLARARETAACVGEALDLEPLIVPQLAERSWGELEGKPRALRITGATPAGGESIDAFRARTLQGLRQVRASRLPLLVAHSGTFRVLAERLKIPPRDAPIDNCAPLLFRPQRDGWRIETLP